MPRFSKRVLSHVQSIAELCELRDEIFHGPGVIGHGVSMEPENAPRKVESCVKMWYTDAMPQEAITPPQADVDTVSPGFLTPAIHHLGIPVLVFGATFCAAMLVVAMFVTPDRFPVRVAGGVYRIGDLGTERDALLARQAALLSMRREMRQRDIAPTLRLLQEIKRNAPYVGAPLQAIIEVLHAWESQPSGATFTLDAVSYRDATLFIEGSVVDPTGRSIPVVAGIVDALRAVAGVASIEEPEYIAIPLPEGGSRSPVSLVISLSHAH